MTGERYPHFTRMARSRLLGGIRIRKFARNEREEEMVEASLFKIIQQAAKLSDPNQDKIFISPPTNEIPIFPIQVRSISRALTNLLDNALKYGRRATLFLETSSETITLIVEDEGTNVSEDFHSSRMYFSNRFPGALHPRFSTITKARHAK